MNRSQMVNIFFTVFILLVGFGLIMPLMPFYVVEYGGSEFLVGLLVAVYALTQFVGAPLLGRLSDRKGRRPLLAFSMAGTALGFVLLAVSDPLGRALAGLFAGGEPSISMQNNAVLGVLFFSRFITGLTGGSITVAQAYIADVTDARNRTQGMGLLGAAFGLGFILGPVMGGMLSPFGFAVPAYTAAALSTLAMITILTLLPESLTPERKAELARRPAQPLVSLAGILHKMRLPRLGPLLTIRLFVSIAMALFMSLFTLWTQDRLGLGARPTSYLMAYIGLLSVLAQGLLINPLTRRYSPGSLIVWSSAVLAAAMLGWALTPSVWVLVIVMIPHAFASGVLNTVINTATSWAVPPHEMGDALGTSASLESLSRVVAPTLGGWLLGAVGAWAPGLLGALLLVGLTPYAWRRLVQHPAPPLADALALEAEIGEELAAA